MSSIASCVGPSGAYTIPPPLPIKRTGTLCRQRSNTIWSKQRRVRNVAIVLM